MSEGAGGNSGAGRDGADTVGTYRRRRSHCLWRIEFDAELLELVLSQTEPVSVMIIVGAGAGEAGADGAQTDEAGTVTDENW